MAKKTPSSENKAKKAAILKELESVKALLNEDLPTDSPKTDSSNNSSEEELASIEFEPSKSSEPPEEFQIPLLDPAKTTTFELDFSKNKSETEAPVRPTSSNTNTSPDSSTNANAGINTSPKQSAESIPENIPTVDDITASSSLFDDDEEEDEGYQAKTSIVTEKQLKDQAQLIIQDLLNEAITELEEKLDHLIPNLEERLKKRLEKAMDEYIDEALKK